MYPQGCHLARGFAQLNMICHYVVSQQIFSRRSPSLKQKTSIGCTSLDNRSQTWAVISQISNQTNIRVHVVTIFLHNGNSSVECVSFKNLSGICWTYHNFRWRGFQAARPSCLTLCRWGAANLTARLFDMQAPSQCKNLSLCFTLTIIRNCEKSSCGDVPLSSFFFDLSHLILVCRYCKREELSKS